MAKPETCLLKCKKCGKILTAQWSPGGFFSYKRGWYVPACPGCSTDQEAIEIDTVLCPHCGARVEKADHKTCLSCGEILIQPEDLSAVQCPNCKMDVYLPLQHKGSLICSHCRYEIPEDYLTKVRPIAAPKAEAQYIRLPDTRELTEKNMIIWKHPVNVFPFKSRLQVNDGTYALMYQNGLCRYPYGPGSYLLEESNLTREQRFDVALHDEEDNTVFHTDIYCVLKNLPEFVWGIVTQEIAGGAAPDDSAELSTPAFETLDREAVFVVRSSGRVMYSVCDPKAFMDFVGSQSTSVEELLGAEPAAQHAGRLVEMTRKEINEAMYTCMRNMAAAEKVNLDRLRLRQPEVTEALIREMNRRVLSYGLCVNSLVLTSFSPEETDASRKWREMLKQIRQMAETPFRWEKELTLHEAGNAGLSARFSFSGSCRIEVRDKEKFLELPEIGQYLKTPDHDITMVKTIVTQKCQSLVDSQLQLVLQAQIDQGRIADFLSADLYPQAAAALQEEMNRYLGHDGLSVLHSMLNVPAVDDGSYSPELQLKKELENKAEFTVPWAKDVSLHEMGDANLFSLFSFNGQCRVAVTDRERFMKLPEIRGYLNEPGGAATIEAIVARKCQAIVDSQLPQVLQSWIDQGKVGNFLLTDQYAQAAPALQEAMNRFLQHDELNVLYLMMNPPAENPAARSVELAAKLIKEAQRREFDMEMEERRQKLEWFVVQDQLLLATQPIRVHMKDDSSIGVTAQFTGRCQLRVRDREVYFASAEAVGFLYSKPFVTKDEVVKHYREKMNPPFNSILSVIVQAVVDQTNADVSELNRMVGILQDNLLANMNQRIAAWGLSAESVDLDAPVYLESSPNLQAWKDLHKARTGTELQNEMDRIKNDRVIFLAEENGRVEIKVDQTHTDVYKQVTATKEERAETQAAFDESEDRRKTAAEEREHAANLRRFDMDQELEKLLAEAEDSRKTRSFEEIRTEYQRRYTLNEENLRQQIREQQIRQQARLEAEETERKAEFDKLLAQAENKKAMNDILRKIDESDMDWKQKLDEYARLRRQLEEKDEAEYAREHARTRADVDWIEAESKGRIQREENDVFYVVDNTRIKLKAEEADLLDSIERRAEERQEKAANARQELDQRRADVEFERKMREREQQLSDEMRRLAQRYQQDLVIREKDDALYEKDQEQNKLKFMLSFLKKTLQGKKKAELAQLNMDKEIRLAEERFELEKQKAVLDAEKERALAQEQRDQAVARDAVSLNEKLIEVQQALAMSRLDNEKNADNQKAQVEIHRFDADQAKAQADEAKAQADQAKAQADQARAEADQVQAQQDGKQLNLDAMKLFQSFGQLQGALSETKQTLASQKAEPAASAELLRQMTDIINGILERVMPAVNQPAAAPAAPDFTNSKRCTNCSRWNTAEASQCYYCHAPFIKM